MGNWALYKSFGFFVVYTLRAKRKYLKTKEMENSAWQRKSMSGMKPIILQYCSGLP
jgi:hypothetical protein